jgi:hypothetical protein
MKSFPKRKEEKGERHEIDIGERYRRRDRGRVEGVVKTLHFSVL